MKFYALDKFFSWKRTLFFLTSYQSCDQPEHVPVKVEKPSNDFTAELTLEQLFAQLDISDYAETFIKEGIDMEALLLCNDDDLKEGGLPLGMYVKFIINGDIKKSPWFFMLLKVS